MNKWFIFKLGRTKEVWINMFLIGAIELGRDSVTIGEYEISGEDSDRFRREFARFSKWLDDKGIV